ncbi:MAG: 5-formyltetrahydrofolate cyclo-ligase [Bacteroidales bacterium]|nr:5-formyltetrahydrofolate cyclo-ligase [Bacteroidales bacterium]
MEKTELRKIVRAAKKAVSLEEKIRRSQPIMQQVEQLDSFQNADTVLLYWSMDDEVYTHDFVMRWYKEKTILLPCVNGDDLLLRRYTGSDSMQPGPQFGIPEPVGPVFEDIEHVQMIVVPGVAFDRNRNRMGRGRGFYDRLLKSTPNAVKVGVAFSFQLFDTIPTEPFDVPMDVVISE